MTAIVRTMTVIGSAITAIVSALHAIVRAMHGILRAIVEMARAMRAMRALAPAVPAMPAILCAMRAIFNATPQWPQCAMQYTPISGVLTPSTQNLPGLRRPVLAVMIRTERRQMAPFTTTMPHSTMG